MRLTKLMTAYVRRALNTLNIVGYMSFNHYYKDAKVNSDKPRRISVALFLSQSSAACTVKTCS